MAFLREFLGVADEVERYLPQPLRVEHQVRHVAGPAPQFQAGPSLGDPHSFHDVLQKFRAIGGFGQDLHLSRFEFREVENVVYQGEERLAADENRIDGLRALRLRLRRILQHLGEAYDGVERRADIVADRREEVAPGLRVLPLPVAFAPVADFVAEEGVFVPAQHGAEIGENCEGERHESGLDESAAQHHRVHLAAKILHVAYPVLFFCFRGVRQHVVVKLDDLVEDLSGGVSGDLAHPKQRHHGDQRKDRYPHDCRFPEASVLVAPEDGAEEDETEDAPQHEEKIRFRGHHRA